ncbi:putative Transcriptional regulator, IclR family [Candidatus Microthrix parvicella RN1]|jgi:DNA-binding IclR family transcriptional regulator|uniref:Putative Transcriptional regulator, IclR family n=2 Tax=Microthrixaceae TaxID=1798913 RepID=R4Z3T7_9ACTN|nr:putative Transcriptional regulator, IclR family [Candidatus Microthrix parvicella RN1]
MVAMSSTDGNPGTGVGVLDKAMSIVAALEQGPAKLAELTEATGMSRATVHRLASSLDDHGLLRRTADGSFALGYRLVGLAALALSDSALADTARPVVTRLRDVTGESAQLWLPDGEWRVCVVSVEATHELRTIVGEGARVPIEVGSGGRALLGAVGPEGWVVTVGERADGVGSVSAPVRGAGATVVAAVGISGPVDRIGVDPGASYGTHVLQAAAELSLAVGGRRHG